MKFCFWGNLASAFRDYPIGGGEKQLALLALLLSEKNHVISVIDFKIKDDKNINGIEIYSLNSRVKWYLPRMFVFYSLAKKINADVYYSRIRGWNHIFPFIASRKVKAVYIQSLASDLDVESFSQRVNFFYKKKSLFYFFTRGILVELIWPRIIAKADIIICQHQGQKGLLKLKNNVFVLNSLTKTIMNTLSSENLNNGFLFIGSIDKRKGLDLIIDVIERLPDCNFILIGKPRDKKSRLAFEKKIATKHNIEHIGKLNNNDVLLKISNCKAVLSVSLKEGFPNIFIEAWSLGKPVVSLYIGLSGLIEDNSLGVYCDGNFEKFITTLNKFDITYNSLKIKEFYKANFNNQQIVDNFIRIINNFHKKYN